MGGALLPIIGGRPQKAGIMSPQALVYGLIWYEGGEPSKGQRRYAFSFQLSPLSTPDANIVRETSTVTPGEKSQSFFALLCSMWDLISPTRD